MNWTFAKKYRILILLGIFAIAMGILEAIVVVYLRQIYYPQGFYFPLSMLSHAMVFVEWTREIATIIMLVMIGILAGKDTLQRFLCFLYSFAVWDIFYYAGLKLFLNWPPSFVTWDILFLIPVPWISPVLAPLLCSLTMLLFAGGFICLQERGCTVTIKPYEWGLCFLGSLIILCSFIWDFSTIIIQNGFCSSFRTLSENGHFWQVLSYYTPAYYHWYLFALGELLIVLVSGRAYRRTRTNRRCPGWQG